MSELAQGTRTPEATLNPIRRRSLSFGLGDRVAFGAGIVLTVLLLAFFSWRMVRSVSRDRALAPVPMNVAPLVPE